MKSSEHKKALAHLKKDPILRKIIKNYQLQELNGEIDLFADIIESIINQQLSGKAAATIYKRFKDLFKQETSTPVNEASSPLRSSAPSQILKVSDEEIRKCGISFSKIKYIKGIAEAVENKSLNLSNLINMSDEEVIQELVKLKGIGRWTAEMILIFSLRRPDVFSTGDLGLRTAVSVHYKIDRENKKKIEEISKKWSPYRSLAARLLWKSLDNAP